MRAGCTLETSAAASRTGQVRSCKMVICLTGSSDLQISTQAFGVLEPLASSTHCPFAVQPAGGGGHGDDVEQAGAQTFPASPVTVTATSPPEQGPALGSP